MHDPSVCGDCWFLRRVMRKLVKRFTNEILVGVMIPKERLYQCFSWWFRLGREDSREVLRFLARAFEGVVFSNHGLTVPRTYLPQGGEPNGVGA